MGRKWGGGGVVHLLLRLGGAAGGGEAGAGGGETPTRHTTLHRIVCVLSLNLLSSALYNCAVYS